MESLASMATNKPARNWVDSDINRAAVELAQLAQQFIRAEVFAHVKGSAGQTTRYGRGSEYGRPTHAGP